MNQSWQKNAWNLKFKKKLSFISHTDSHFRILQDSKGICIEKKTFYMIWIFPVNFMSAGTVAWSKCLPIWLVNRINHRRYHLSSYNLQDQLRWRVSETVSCRVYLDQGRGKLNSSIYIHSMQHSREFQPTALYVTVHLVCIRSCSQSHAWSRIGPHLSALRLHFFILRTPFNRSSNTYFHIEHITCAVVIWKAKNFQHSIWNQLTSSI